MPTAVPASPQLARMRVSVRSLPAYFIPALLSAVMLVLAFPLPGWGWLAHVALVPIVLMALRAHCARRLLWTSYLVSLAWWVFMLRWLDDVTVGGWLGLSAYMAVYLPAALLTVRFLDRRYRAAMVLVLPLVWVSLEFFRGWFLEGGFGWFALSHTQAPFRADQSAGRLMQIADVFGEHGVSFLVAMTNGLVVDLLSRPWIKPRQGRAGVSRTIRASAIVWLLAITAAWFYGNHRIRTAPTDTPTLDVAVVQTNVPQSNKDDPARNSMIDDWHRMVELTVEAAPGLRRNGTHPGLIVWPETMVPASLNDEALEFYRQRGNGYEEFHKQIGQLARTVDAYLLVGAASSKDWRSVTDEAGNTFSIPAERYNSAFLYRPDGSRAPMRFDKIHRVPFGEFVPWVDHWPWLKRHFIRIFTPYDFDYTLRAGKAWTLFEVNGEQGAARLATPICFEDAVPRVCRRMAYDPDGRKRADLLVNLTNDGWYPDTHQPLQHLQIATFRSVENRVPTARSVNTGVSGFIDSVGKIGPVVERGGRSRMVDGFAVHRVRFDDRLSVFGRIGHWPVYIVMGVTAALVVLGFFRRDKVAPRRA